MKILYFGTYSRGEEYARNLALIEGLKKAGCEVQECHQELWSEHQDKMEAVRGGLYSLIQLLRSYFLLLKKYFRVEKNFDYMFVGYIGHLDVFLARLLKIFHKKPIVFDTFYSLYDTMIKDRKLYSEQSLKARALKLIDRWSVKCSDLALLDTQAHIKYFAEEFGLEESKFIAVPLGVDENNFYPRAVSETSERFEVLNYSSYIPLHGLEVIIDCAKILEKEKEKDIHFTLIGKGQLYPRIRERAQRLGLENVEFIEWLSHQELVERAVKADVLLGIFGTTEKALRVIPYKVYEALALAKPVITEDSPASRELLEDGKHCLLSPPGAPQALAEKILLLKSNPELRERIAQEGHKLFLEKCSWGKIGERIVTELKNRFGG